MSETTTTAPTRIFLLSVPRTTSNMLMRLFSQSPKVTQLDYPFMWATMWGPDSIWTPPAAIPAQAVAGLRKQYESHSMQGQMDVMQKFVKDAEDEGKLAMIKEHTQNLVQLQMRAGFAEDPSKRLPTLVDNAIDGAKITVSPELDSSNITYVPTRFLLSVTPTFIIRHPARVLPSFVRASNAIMMTPTDPFFALAIDYQFSRQVFDWYCSSPAYAASGKKPTIIDADDLVADTPRTMKAWCDALGLKEEELIKYSWEKQEGELSHVHKAFLGTVHGSEGVIKNDKNTKPVDLEVEYKSWITEFGEENAAIMKDLVEQNMANYEYLKQYRL